MLPLSNLPHTPYNCATRTSQENYFVTQTIEGPVEAVVLLWNRIKADPRIQEVVESSFGLKEERAYTSWGLVLQANERDWGRNFMAEHCKHRILHHNNVKTVYIIEDIRTNQHYVLKEILVLDNIHNLPENNEHDILKKVYASTDALLEGRTGIICVPDIFHELVKISMIYPLYPMDLFNAINYNTALFKTEGFEEKIIVTFVAQLMEALFILKKRGVVHRDIKPENICVDENGNLVLMDFELAVHLDVLTGVHTQQDNVLVGTTLYIAPEAYRRLEYSSSSDVWAVAMVACELHSSVLPWNVNEHMTLDQVGRTIIGNPPQKPKAMSHRLWSLLSKMLRGKPEDRISVEEAMDDPIFASFTFMTHDEDGQMIPGNVFDKHDYMEPVRTLNRERGLLSTHATMSSRERFNKISELNSSPKITRARNVFVENISSPATSPYPSPTMPSREASSNQSSSNGERQEVED
ncbi:hypothetical protein TL16_g00371 [Triparma laevis f. inornata]|uniref:Protein kinase domain-containing protein n=1 Tax=Triparma laevis f. inornata TaxID=1714386 RepID=A0A9W7DNN6_9STRA|nr:hypothetical protein TL16_g00371 [Triparma laevis f. inornata]